MASPGIMDTPSWDSMPADQREALFRDHAARLPVGRVGRARDIAAAVVMMATNGFITGSVVEAAGGVYLATGR